jgi:predicted short-subunit dehydrogenase-like oxidoreductase (DUF2520 family)
MVAAHCSGAHPAAILAHARARGAAVGSIHPLQTFATRRQAVRLLPGSWCGIEGDPAALEVLRAVAQALRMTPLQIPSDRKPLYHAAAAVASNYLVALEQAAVTLAEAAGVPSDQALPALLPLVRGTVENLEQVGLPQSLTGPIARGDVGTVRAHLAAIGRHAPDLLALYRTLGLQAMQVAREKGSLSAERCRELRELLSGRQEAGPDG